MQNVLIFYVNEDCAYVSQLPKHKELHRKYINYNST